MPITPFHGGVGLACKGALTGRFSFTIFVATQVVIDLESAYFLFTGGHPVHRFLHTFIGASLVCLFVAVVARPACERFLRFYAALLGDARPHWLNLTPRISVSTSLLSAGVGMLGHVIPDSIMHADAKPLAPFSDKNPFLGALSLTHLHLGLVLVGAIGFLWMSLVTKQPDHRD